MSGYAPSLMQEGELPRCYLCGNTAGKLDRHEPWHGLQNRRKSQELGLWCWLCHEPCHLSIAHRDRETDLFLKRTAERAALEAYGWTKEDFIRKFGKNVL